jgi:hypothetical protein
MNQNQSNLKYITGPVSYSLVEWNVDNYKRTIHMFGDYHFSKSNNCERLKNISCSSASNMINSECESIELLFMNMMDYAQKKNIMADFFFEVAIDLTNTLRVKRVEEDYLSDIEQEFNSFMLKTKQYTPNIKFHYVDSRKSTVIHSTDLFFKLYWLLKEIPNINQSSAIIFWHFLIDKILPFLPDLYFLDDYHEKMVEINNLIQKEVLRYNKELVEFYQNQNFTPDVFYNYLEREGQVVFLQMIMKKRGDKYVSIMKAELDKLFRIQPDIANKIKEFIKNKINIIKSSFSRKNVDIILLMQIAAIYMDGYFLSRMLYNIYNTKSEQIIGIYAGDEHIKIYNDFFINMNIPFRLNIPIRFDQNGNPIRCLEHNDFKLIFPYANPVMIRDPLVAYKSIYLNTMDQTNLIELSTVNQFISSNDCFKKQVSISNYSNDVNLERSFVAVLYRKQVIVGTATVYFYNKMNQYVIYNLCINRYYRKKGYVDSIFKYIRQIMNDQSILYQNDPYLSQLSVNPYSDDVKDAAKSYIKLGYKNPKIQFQFPSYKDIDDKTVVSTYPYLLIGLTYFPSEQVNEQSKEQTFKKVSEMIEEMRKPSKFDDSLLIQVWNRNVDEFGSFSYLYKSKFNAITGSKQKELMLQQKREIYTSLLTFEYLSCPFPSLKFLLNTFGDRKDIHYLFQFKDVDSDELKKIIRENENIYDSKLLNNKDFIKNLKQETFNVMKSSFDPDDLFKIVNNIQSDYVVFNSCVVGKDGIVHNDFMIIYQNYFPKKWVHIMTQNNTNDNYFKDIESKINPSQFQYKPFNIQLKYSKIPGLFLVDYLNLCNRLIVQYFFMNSKQIYPSTWDSLIEFGNNLGKENINIFFDKYVSNIIKNSLS